MRSERADSLLSRRNMLAWLAVLLAFLALDALWLTLAGPRLYRPALAHLMRTDFLLLPAAAFYLLYAFGLLAFVIAPAHSVGAAAARGALFGLIAYATYDLTNQATLPGWPWQVTLADLAWGAAASAASGAFGRRVSGAAQRR